MDDKDMLKDAVDKLSREIEALTKQRDDIMDKLSDLIYKRDILVKATTVAAEVLGEKAPARVQQEADRKIIISEGPKDNKGMTAETLKLLSPLGTSLSVRQVLEALMKKGYKTRRVNVYIMLKRLVEAGRLSSTEESGILKYGMQEKEREKQKRGLLY